MLCVLAVSLRRILAADDEASMKAVPRSILRKTSRAGGEQIGFQAPSSVKSRDRFTRANQALPSSEHAFVQIISLKRKSRAEHAFV